MKNNNNTNKNSCDATNNNIEEMYDWFERTGVGYLKSHTCLFSEFTSPVHSTIFQKSSNLLPL